MQGTVFCKVDEPLLFCHILPYLTEPFQKTAMRRLVSLGMVSPTQLNRHYHSLCEEFERRKMPYCADVSYKWVYLIISSAWEKGYKMDAVWLRANAHLAMSVMEGIMNLARATRKYYDYLLPSMTYNTCDDCKAGRPLIVPDTKEMYLLGRRKAAFSCLECKSVALMTERCFYRLSQENAERGFSYLLEYLPGYLHASVASLPYAGIRALKFLRCGDTGEL